MSLPPQPVAQQLRRGLKDGAKDIIKCLISHKNCSQSTKKPPKGQRPPPSPQHPAPTPPATRPAPTPTPAPPSQPNDTPAPPPPPSTQAAPSETHTQPSAPPQAPSTNSNTDAQPDENASATTVTRTFASMSASDAPSSPITIVIPGASSVARVGGSGTTQDLVVTSSDPFAATSAPGSASKTSTPNATGATHKSNAGVIAGAVLGALIFLILIFFAVILIRRRRRRNLAPSSEFLNNSFQPAFMENSSYAFGSNSPYATSSSNQTPMSYTPTRSAYPASQHIL